jgi:uncharacterized delta-60 repeat protein
VGTTRRGARLLVAWLTVAALIAALTAVAGAGAADTTEATTYGQDGTASPSLGSHFEETGFGRLYARPDGGLLAGRLHGFFGEVVSPVESFAADGTAEPVTATFPPAIKADVAVPEGAQAIGELGSGKVVAYKVLDEGPRRPEIFLHLTVLNPDGSGEQTFVLGLPPVLNFDTPKEIIPTADGGALLVNSQFLVALRADGSPNPAFGKGGLVNISELAGARVLADGSIEAVGDWYDADADTERLAVRRLTATGAPDSSFAPEGLRVFDRGEDETANAAAWAPDGSVYIAGEAQSPPSCDYGHCETVPIVAAIDPAGNLMPGFGQGGVAKLPAFASYPGETDGGTAGALVLRPDGSLVVGGSGAPEGSVAFLAALTPQGRPLTSFGENGVVRVRQPVPAEEQVGGLRALPGGKLLAAVGTDAGISERSALARYGADGDLDQSFGAGAGFVGVGDARGARTFAVRGDEVLIAGWGYPHDALILAHVGDGSAVSSFGDDGSVLMPSRAFIEAVAFGAEDDPVAMVNVNGPGSSEPTTVYGFDRDGRHDRSFGHRGEVPLTLPGGGEVKGRALLALGGGRVLVAGVDRGGFAVERLLPDGRPDPRFGVHGWAQVRVAGRAKSVALARVGAKVYLAGSFAGESDRGVVLARLGLDGRPDKSFGDRGRRTVPVADASAPTAVLPTRAGIVVTLEQSSLPLLTFAPGGKVRQRALTSPAQTVTDVHATVSQGHLIVGWVPFVGNLPQRTYNLSRLPLG